MNLLSQNTLRFSIFKSIFVFFFCLVAVFVTVGMLLLEQVDCVVGLFSREKRKVFNWKGMKEIWRKKRKQERKRKRKDTEEPLS